MIMIKIDLDRMAKILGVKSPEAYDEAISENPNDIYGVVYREALSEGCSEEQAEEKAMQAEPEERESYVRKYISNLVNVFEQEAENLKLDVTPLKTKPGVYALTPKEGWVASAVKTRSIVHGIGGWWFTSFKEFLSSGPYTPRQAVEAHLGYLGSQWKLYGYASPERRVLAD
jgi:phosphatidate phosphatase APP1